MFRVIYCQMQWCANFISSRIKNDQNAKRQIPSYFLIKAWFLLDLQGNHSSKFVKIMSHIEDFQHDLRPSWNRLQVGFNIKDMKFTNLFLLGVPIFICVKNLSAFPTIISVYCLAKIVQTVENGFFPKVVPCLASFHFLSKS